MAPATSPSKRALPPSATPPPPTAKKPRRSHSPSTPLELSAAAAALIPALVSPTTADEVEHFLEVCVQWQANLAAATRAIEAKAAQLEKNEVALMLSNMVDTVEQHAREESVTQREAELEALRAAVTQHERELERTMRRVQQEHEERDAFETLERRVLDDRVAELEVQLAQNKAREVEKDDEITRLRAEQDALDATSCVVPKSEWAAHLAAHQQLGHEADEWRRQCAALQEQLDAAALEAQELTHRLAAAKAQDETRAFEDLETRLLEERVEELTAQLQSAGGAALTEALEGAQLQLRAAEAEATVKKNEVARLLNDKAALKQQAKALAGDLKAAAREADACRAQVAEERARAAQLAAAATQRQAELEALAAQQNADSARELAALRRELESVRARLEAETKEREAAPTTDARVVQLELEKREILDFFRCYFEASETKCRQLMRELSQQEAEPHSEALGRIL
ncbi:hypothetical protein PybrP1_009299 [[Pythium] brassicae (nom. inval.)]|nr:hypothetical protein PybrP1_009299 [[Pythium] brassicae (nom. inval.)]